MKINVVTSFFWPVSGDVEDYPYNIARIVKESKNELEVLTTDVWPDGKKIERQNPDEYKGMKIKRFKCFANLTWFVKLWFPVFENPDIIHCCGGFRHPHFLASFLKRKNAKFFISPFFPMHPKQGLLQKLYVKIGDWTINRFIVKRANCCFAETEMEKKWLESLGAKKVVILPNSLSDKAFVKGDKKRFFKKYKIKGKIIFSLGRHVPIKNFEEIINVLKDIDATLVIGGETTEYTEKLKLLIKELKLEKKVIFPGFMDANAKADAYSACDLFVLSSIRESLGTVVIEAMAQEKPVIATNTGGLNEVVPDKFCLYEQGNLDELREKINLFLNDKKFARAIGIKGKKKAIEKFSFKKMKEKYLGAIKNA